MTKNEILVLAGFVKAQKADVDTKADALLSYIGVNDTLTAFGISINVPVTDSAKRQIAKAVLTSLVTESQSDIVR